MYFLSPWYKLGSSGKKGPQLRKCFQRIACTQVCGPLFRLLLGVGELSPLGMTPSLGSGPGSYGKGSWAGPWEWAAFLQGLCSSSGPYLEFLPCLPSMVDCDQGIKAWYTLTSQSCFWSCSLLLQKKLGQRIMTTPLLWLEYELSPAGLFGKAQASTIWGSHTIFYSTVSPPYPDGNSFL